MLPKVILGELNGVKVFKRLLTLFATDLGFSQSGWASSTVHDAILEAATGGDPRPSDLITGTITIATNKHHIVMNDLTIDGDLVIDGEVGVI